MSVKNFLKKLFRYTLCLAAGLFTFAACGYTDYRLWPLELPALAHPRMPVTALKGKQLVVPFSLEVPAAEIATFNDQLEAFLRFEYLRGREAREGYDTSHMYLTPVNAKKGPQYKIFVVTDNDLLTAVPQVASFKSRNLITHYEFETWSQKEYNYYQQQSHTFDVAYDVPTEQKLEEINSSKLLPALAQFLIFKSQTDNRVVDNSDSAARPLTQEQATQLATDILDVAHFYDLPLDYFMGVGAMENDYMDVNGDLTHAVWKKRADRGDIVLQRTRKRVKVSDYAQLPARLRPSRELDLNNVPDAVLTTYAGLLLRDLLDHFGGDVEKAIGAYNGGVKTPNPAYASSVKNIADYARRILEHSTAQDDPNAKGKGLDKSQSAAPCKPAASTDAQNPNKNAQATNASGCVSPNTATDATPPKPKPPYRRTDD